MTAESQHRRRDAATPDEPQTTDRRAAAETVDMSCSDGGEPRAARPGSTPQAQLETIDVTVAGGEATQSERRHSSLAEAASGGSTAPGDSTAVGDSGHVVHPGRRFGRYLILSELGGGGMGQVYLAEDTQLDRRVALKVPSLDPRDREHTIQRFLREARAAATIGHPHICPLYDAGEIEGVWFLTMAYIEGCTLHELVAERGPLPPGEAAIIIRKVALALQEAHQHGVVHRDLKPSNLMVDQRGEPVILDFGLARRRGKIDIELTQEGNFLGTPAFMSPEQISGSHDEIGPATDIYSLGVVLYQLLTGHLPFTGATSGLVSEVLTMPPRPPGEVQTGIPPELSAICLRCLEKQPALRYATAAELARKLAPFCSAAVPVPEPVATGGLACQPSPVHDSHPEQSDGRLAGRRHAATGTRQEFPSATVLEPVLASFSERPVLPGSRRTRWVVFGAAAAVILVSVLLLNLARERDANRPTEADGSAFSPAAGAAPAAGSQPRPSGSATLSPPRLTVRYQQPDSESYTELARRAPRAVPVPHGALVQLHVELDEPAYLYLYWYDATGTPKRLWPKSPQNQPPLRELSDPPAPDAAGELDMYPVVGATGLELALAAASREPLSADDLQSFENLRLDIVQRSAGQATGFYNELQRAIGEPVRVPRLGRKLEQPHAAVLVVPPDIEDRLHVVEPARSTTSGIRSLGDPVTTVLGRPRFDNQLDLRFDTYQGLLFPHR